MKFGCSTPYGDAESLADFLPAYVELLRDRPVESVWLGEHTHLPLGTDHKYTNDGEVPDRYLRFPDPWIVLATVAAHVPRVRLGSLVTLVAEHNPLVLAKVVATLDVITGGRVEFGVGYGWNRLEMVNNGVDPLQVGGVFREKLAAIRKLWQNGHAGFDGDFVNFSDSWSLPTPLQRPGPPISIGAAATPRTLRDVAQLADGWIPALGMMGADLEGDLVRLREHLVEAGRDLSSVTVSVFHPGTAFGRVTASGFQSRLPTDGDIERYERLGVARVICSIPTYDIGLTEKTLDLYSALIDRWAPRA